MAENQKLSKFHFSAIRRLLWERKGVMESVTSASDGELMQGVTLGDQRCLAEIYARHGSPAFGLAARVTGDRTAAEDVVQEVLLALWNRPERFDPARGSLRSLLLAMVHGRAVDHVRSREARRRREIRDAVASQPLSVDIDRHAWDLVVRDQVSTALATLSEIERRPIELAYFDGRTYKEVAEMLDIAEGTIKSRIRSGLARLRVVLDEQGVLESRATTNEKGVS
jgi:RNA polymerase sigma-70 factor (ECF subfamily)